jgi:hypothetical protein
MASSQFAQQLDEVARDRRRLSHTQWHRNSVERDGVAIRLAADWVCWKTGNVNLINPVPQLLS